MFIFQSYARFFFLTKNHLQYNILSYSCHNDNPAPSVPVPINNNYSVVEFLGRFKPVLTQRCKLSHLLPPLQFFLNWLEGGAKAGREHTQFPCKDVCQQRRVRRCGEIEILLARLTSMHAYWLLTSKNTQFAHGF